MKKNPVKTAIDQATQRLGKEARLVIRASGTEPVICMMVKAHQRKAWGGGWELKWSEGGASALEE